MSNILERKNRSQRIRVVKEQPMEIVPQLVEDRLVQEGAEADQREHLRYSLWGSDCSIKTTSIISSIALSDSASSKYSTMILSTNAS
jgi:hypothetical protein